MSFDIRVPLEASIAAPLFDLSNTGYYSSVAGYSHVRHVQCTEINKLLYQKIFKIFDSLGLKYYVFAGALVGFVRDGMLPPWLDDMDIMIFKEHKEFFENEVVPLLQACGFNCRPVGKGFLGGGFHILGLQSGPRRDDALPFTQSTSVSIPWFQVDVFYSEHTDGLVKNTAKWGLYHNRNVQSDWVCPGQNITMEGIVFPTFSNIIDDVMEEYGDVLNNVVVKTHGQTFLVASNLAYDVFINNYRNILNATATLLPPGVSRSDLSLYSGSAGQTIDVSPDMSFENIVKQIVFKDASSIDFSSSHHLFWSRDLKRLFPKLSVTVTLDNMRDVRNAAMLKDSIDDVCSSKQHLVSAYRECQEAFERFGC